jgi:hypothetical protein
VLVHSLPPFQHHRCRRRLISTTALPLLPQRLPRRVPARAGPRLADRGGGGGVRALRRAALPLLPRGQRLALPGVWLVCVGGAGGGTPLLSVLALYFVGSETH